MTQGSLIDYSELPRHDGRVIRRPATLSLIEVFGEAPSIEMITRHGLDPHELLPSEGMLVARHIIAEQTPENPT